MNLGFDIYAMVNPKNPEDILALLQEARQELRNINEYLDGIIKGT